MRWKETEMTDAAAGGKIQETQIARYRSTRGLDYGSVPWKLWEKSKKLFWDPADVDFSRDAIDWQEMSDEERTLVALSARGFMVGEEAVTLDIVPLLRCMSDMGRLEDTMYLAMFAMEEAKHTEMFRRWFDAVGLDPASLDSLVLQQQAALGQRRTGIFDGALTKVMRRLDTDRSPKAVLDATLIYNQFVEGVAAIAGYHAGTRRSARSASCPACRRDWLSPSATNGGTSPTAPISRGGSSRRIRSCGSGSSSAGSGSPRASSAGTGPPRRASISNTGSG
jgi:ribonucleotide reductase beta subunit family protein with ferritin-like domain